MCDVKLGVAKSLYNAVDYHVQTLDSTLGSVSARLRAFGEAEPAPGTVLGNRHPLAHRPLRRLAHNPDCHGLVL